MRMESSETAAKSNILEGFVEVPSEFINSLISRRVPLLFEKNDDGTDKSAPLENKERSNDYSDPLFLVEEKGRNNNIIDDESGSSDIEIIDEFPAVPEKNRSNGVKQGPTNHDRVSENDSNNLEKEDPLNNFEKENPPNNFEKGDPPNNFEKENALNSLDKENPIDLEKEDTIDLEKEDSNNVKKSLTNGDHNYCSNNATDIPSPVESLKVSSEVVSKKLGSELAKKLNADSSPLVQYLTAKEIDYRRGLESSFDFLDYRLHCTACDLHIGARSFLDCELAVLHPSLFVLICSGCLKRSKLINVASGQNVCSWCYFHFRPQATGIAAVHCTTCRNIFCGSCIGRNLGISELLSLEKKKYWKCFLCDAKPIWRLRLIASKLINFVKKKRAQLTNALYSNTGAVEDVDISRCCKSNPFKNNDTVVLSESAPAPTSHSFNLTHRNPVSTGPITLLPFVPTIQQSEYCTPLFSGFSNPTDTAAEMDNSNFTLVRKSDNHFIVCRKVSNEGSESTGKTFSISRNAYSAPNKPIDDIVVIDDSPEDSNNHQSFINRSHDPSSGNENLPPPSLATVGNHSESMVRSTLLRDFLSSRSELSSQSRPKPGIILKKSKAKQSKLSQPVVNVNKITKKLKDLLEGENRVQSGGGNKPSKVEWINNALSSVSSLLDSCQNDLNAIVMATMKTSQTDDMEVRVANMLHDFTRNAVSRLHDVDCKVLENYWLMKKGRKNFGNNVSSFDKIAQEFSDLFDEPDTHSTEIDPGAFLEIALSDGETGETQQSYTSNKKLDYTSRKVSVKLIKCDSLINSNLTYKSIARFKPQHKLSVNYSRKIESLIERFGISECKVALVPLEYMDCKNLSYFTKNV